MSKQENDRQYIVFELAGEKFGIDVEKSREIVEVNKLTIVPETPDYIEGIMKLRDDIITVVNLNKKMKLEDETKKKKIIMVSINSTIIGLMVKDVKEIIKSKSNKIKSMPDLLKNKIDKELIEGVIEYKDDLLIILRVENLFYDIKNIQ